MSPLKASLRDYLAFRRALGFKLITEQRLLERFVQFAASAGATFITTELALKWVNQEDDTPPGHRAGRLAVLRRWARFASATDPRTIVPPEDLLPSRRRRIAPYLFTDKEIHALIAAARGLPSSSGLRPHTYVTLIGLYAATGLRAGEALRMDRDDVDLVEGILQIRESKFGKSRLVPVHASTCRALRRYAEDRDRIFPRPRSPSFFLSERGTRLSYDLVWLTFRALGRQIGLRTPPGLRAPRICDLRHRFAITTLTHWHRRGADVTRRLPQLSTYMGHSNVANTYWYLTAPQSGALAAFTRACRRDPSRLHALPVSVRSHGQPARCPRCT